MSAPSSLRRAPLSLPLRAAVLFIGLCLALLALPQLSAAYSPSTVSAWTTDPTNPAVRLAPQSDLTFTAEACTIAPAGLPEVDISATQLQPLVGFGAALTESTAYTFLQLKARNASAYSELLLRLFAPAPQGIAMSFMRVPITSCDLSLPTPAWSFDDTPNDVNLANFDTTDAMKWQIPVLQDIMQLARQYGLTINLVGTPWSAPAWIKTPTGEWNSGTIQDVWYDWYVNYLVNVVSTFQSLGVPLYALSIQNEPNFAWGSYPSTTLSPLNESVLANALKPALRAKGLSTLLLAWDSDWWGLDYPLEVLDRVGGDGKSVDGVAFHCYTPNPGPRVQSDLHSRYPNTLILQTECSGFGREKTATDFWNNWRYFLPMLYFDNLANWGSSVHHWALSLDLNDGPQTGGGCIDCASVVTVDAGNATQPYVVQYSSEFYMIGHFSSFIPPNSRLLQTNTSAVANASGLLALAAITPDQTVVVQLLNTAATSPITVLVRDQQAQKCMVVAVLPESLSTFRYATAAGGGGGGGLSAGGWVGVAFAIIIGVVLVGVVGVWLVRRRGGSKSGNGITGRSYQSQLDDNMGIAMS